MDVQASIKAKPGIDCNILVAINGTNVTVSVDVKNPSTTHSHRE
ncbi:hypothetical protein ACFL0H_01965 [Thermodesulfobacteriota bacterium]